MERVATRFLLHNHRETEEVKESDFDELKQEVQMVRFVMTNDLLAIKENLVRYTSILHSGMSLLGEYFVQKAGVLSEESVRKLQHFRSRELNN